MTEHREMPPIRHATYINIQSIEVDPSPHRLIAHVVKDAEPVS